jgi:RHS repeat-associated protein
MKRSTVRHLFLLLLLAAAGSTDSFANHLPPVAVVNFYPERAPLNASNHGRMITGEEVTFDGRASYTTRSGTVVTTYRWSVNGSQTQSGTSPVFTYTAGAAGTNVTIGLEVRDSYGTWSTRRNVAMEVAPVPRRYYYITDHLGSVRAVTNELGELVAYSDYYPFGLEMPKRTLAGDDATKEGFTGHELDAETGLNYAGARYYDPEIGRWLAVDPLDQQPSPYTYSANNPLRFFDPDGLWYLDANGNWVAEDGDTFDTFLQQTGWTPRQARSYFIENGMRDYILAGEDGTFTAIDAGTVVISPAVESVFMETADGLSNLAGLPALIRRLGGFAGKRVMGDAARRGGRHSQHGAAAARELLKQKNRYTNSAEKARKELGLTKLEFRKAIHDMKENLPGNPDMIFDFRTGEVLHPQSGATIGNLLDYKGVR